MLSYLKFIAQWFAPTTTALFNISIPWTYRWRLLCLQPITTLTYSMKYLPWAFSRRCTAIEIPTRGRHTIRALVFCPSKQSTTNPSPLHLHWHGGAWIGGLAEYDAAWCDEVSNRVGAVVVSAQYRYAPASIYPCAHEDAEDVFAWALANARSSWNADPEALTVSGMSVGANLMFTAGGKARAAVGICPAIDFRLPPWEKPKPPDFPKNDPLQFLMPLFDAYAGPVRHRTMDDERLNPIIKKLDDIPRNALFIVAGIDIVAHEELTFIERVKSELQNCGDESRRFEAMVFDKGFHGWLELPIKAFEADRRKAFNTGIQFLLDAHQSD